MVLTLYPREPSKGFAGGAYVSRAVHIVRLLVDVPRSEVVAILLSSSQDELKLTLR
jgi:hypothetical protein